MGGTPPASTRCRICSGLPLMVRLLRHQAHSRCVWNCPRARRRTTSGTRPCSITSCTWCRLPAVMLDRNQTASWRRSPPGQRPVAGQSEWPAGPPGTQTDWEVRNTNGGDGRRRVDAQSGLNRRPAPPASHHHRRTARPPAAPPLPYRSTVTRALTPGARGVVSGRRGGASAALRSHHPPRRASGPRSRHSHAHTRSLPTTVTLASGVFTRLVQHKNPA